MTSKAQKIQEMVLGARKSSNDLGFAQCGKKVIKWLVIFSSSGGLPEAPHHQLTSVGAY